MELSIAMQAADMLKFAQDLVAKSEDAVNNGRIIDVTIYGETNVGSREATINFSSDDMERPEMNGRTIVDVE